MKNLDYEQQMSINNAIGDIRWYAEKYGCSILDSKQDYINDGDLPDYLLDYLENNPIKAH